MALAVVGFLACLALAGASGFWLGVRHALHARVAHDERMSRITGEVHQGSIPHNFAATPARVTQGRIRNRRAFKLHD
jgi:hypothetical protein